MATDEVGADRCQEGALKWSRRRRCVLLCKVAEWNVLEVEAVALWYAASGERVGGGLLGKDKEAGYEKGQSAPTVFYDAKTRTGCVVHGDDFTFLESETEIPKIIEVMKGVLRYQSPRNSRRRVQRR